jgi:hypothetical protein
MMMMKMNQPTKPLPNATLEIRKNPNYVDPDISAYPRRDHTTRNKAIDVVVSRYNRDVSWTEKFRTVAPVRIMVYDKCNSNNPYNVPLNKGNEASVYLKHIVDFYDELPEWTFFVHDEEYSWHHSGSLIDKLQYALDSDRRYFNVNDLAFTDHLTNDEITMVLEWWRIHIEKYRSIKSLPSPLFAADNRACAQFLVHRNRIRSMPLEFYSDMYEWIMRTHLPNYYNGRLFEWTWHLFWDT